MKIKPRGGGLVFVILALLSTSFHGNFSYLFSLPLALISFIDDKYNISSRIRFLVQIFSTYLIIIYFRFESFSSNLFSKNILNNFI